MERTEHSGSGLERKCYECGRAMIGKRENYSYREVGLKSVVLLNIVVYHCKCGAIVPEIPYAGILHNCIAMSILEKKTLVSGEEIRFLRKTAGYSATELARVMGMDKGTVSRWENTKKTIGKESDRLLRLVCFARMMERLAGVNAKQIGDRDLANNLVRIQQMVRELKLTAVLEQIDPELEASKPIRIDPEQLVLEAIPGFVTHEATLQ